MSTDVPQVNFRMPAKLKARLEKAAEANRRTLTSEIIQRLEDSLLSDNLSLVAKESDIRPPSAKELRRLAEIIVILERNALDEEQSDRLFKDHEKIAARPRKRVASE